MEIKVYSIKLDPPRWVRNLVVYVALPVGALLGAAVGVKAGVNLAAPFVKGQPIVAADVNANFKALSDALTVLQGQAHPASGFRAWLTNATSAPNNQTTYVAFDHVEFDSAAAGTTPGEYTKETGVFTPKYSGTYLVNCGFEFVGTATGDWAAVILRNGSPVTATDLEGSSTNGISPFVSVVTLLTAGQPVTCGVNQISGASQALYVGPSARNSFGAARLY